jgi:hypothetical protein
MTSVQAVGGTEAAVLAATTTFYTKVFADPILAVMFRSHDESHAYKLALFVMNFMEITDKFFRVSSISTLHTRCTTQPNNFPPAPLPPPAPVAPAAISPHLSATRGNRTLWRRSASTACAAACCRTWQILWTGGCGFTGRLWGTEAINRGAAVLCCAHHMSTHVGQQQTKP